MKAWVVERNESSGVVRFNALYASEALAEVAVASDMVLNCGTWDRFDYEILSVNIELVGFVFRDGVEPGV